MRKMAQTEEGAMYESVYMYNDLSLYMCTMLIVHPMMELGEDKEAGSGEFDCEIHDRKVGYMVEILKAWHKFQKCEWGGGDSAETKCEDELVDNRMV
ncbi:hypothetical protein HID58_042104 [Brassica napus]|uniref:Uncharacterized protein n=1 Tax=Brassica napus TaxID=3708 RepID=A0ABQ8BEE5_BRANA|nr:hypothetical protein HID58_042104 [Brassica napus]